LTEHTHHAILPMFSDMAKPPEKRYRTIVADPPWKLQLGPTLTEKRVKPALEYPQMEQHQLLNLPVGLWGEDKAHLYLWATNSTLGDALELAKVWGFKYSCLITWLKRRVPGEGSDGEPSAWDDRWQGLGRYYRITTEHVVFAVRGGLDVMHKDQVNFFYAARGRHSEKPAAFYDMVERMSPGPYLDVFARKRRLGWDVFGNESFNAEGLEATLTDEQKSGLTFAP